MKTDLTAYKYDFGKNVIGSGIDENEDLSVRTRLIYL